MNPARESTPTCPHCSSAGQAVTPLTIESLLTDSAKACLARTDGFRFCPTADCPVVYYQTATGLRLQTDAVRVPVFQKSALRDRLVCYCFHHAVSKIEAQVRTTGKSTVLADIKGQCALGLDNCERNNPQGACCLGNVQRVVKTMMAKQGAFVAATPAVESDGIDCCRPVKPAHPNAAPAILRGRWASIGAMGMAVLSSACCWLPLLLLAFGASAAGVAGFFEQYRPWLLTAAVLLLIAGFYFVYIRDARCVPGSACSAPNPRVRRFNHALLWTATLIATTFALFPNYAALFSHRNDATTARGVIPLTFRLEGMTCVVCASRLEASLRNLPGVVSVRVDYAQREARVSVAQDAAPVATTAVLSEVKAAGYQAELR